MSRHGTSTQYRKGCRCPECGAWQQASRRQRYLRERDEADAFILDTKPVETKKYRGLVEEALKAFSLDAGYAVAMTQAASANDLPQESSLERPRAD